MSWWSLVLAAVGVASVVWALAITRSGRQREREVMRLSEEAHRIKNDFVAMISHELRTPLTSIAGFADTLVESWKDLPDEEVDEFLGIINRQSVYLGDLVEDVLVIPRLEADRLRFHPELFDLGDLLGDVAKMVFPTGGKKSSIVSLPDGVRVRADRRRVQQVIRNLMENARKYGGDQVMVEGFVMGDQYLVVISDNGPGVPDEETQRVFENFEQLSKGDTREATGIGLGLPIARRLARAMGGEVWYERRFPTGARFCFSLPLRRRAVLGEDEIPETIDLDATASVELDDETVLAT
ncbi:MAG TPA: HAMP domain-containing sensor histidine kinase [Acidimicrobiia bacterium]